MILKILVDLAMTVLLLLLMAYLLVGETAHEWMGLAMFLLFIFHHLLNRNWYSNLFRGKYTPLRILQTAVDVLLLAAMIGLMISGIILSRVVFGFLPISGGMGFARTLHMIASNWGFLLMSLHLGLHWGMFLGMARKALKLQRPSRLRTVLLPVLSACIAVYGLFVFIRRDLLVYMLVRTHFVFLDFSESILLFYLDYLAMMGAFIFISHYGIRLLRKRSM